MFKIMNNTPKSERLKHNALNYYHCGISFIYFRPICEMYDNNINAFKIASTISHIKYD